MSITRFALTALALILLAGAAVQSAPRAAAAGDQTVAVFGTVINAEQNSIEVATRSGVVELRLTPKTEIRDGLGASARAEFRRGDDITATAKEKAKAQLEAITIQVRGREEQARTDHVVGVVVEKTPETITIASRDGRKTEIETSSGARGAEVSDVVTAVVERRAGNERARLKHIDKVHDNVLRLRAALDHEMDQAQARLVRQMIHESSREHLQILVDTIEQVQAEARQKIEAALAKFHADYAGVAAEVGIEEPVIPAPSTPELEPSEAESAPEQDSVSGEIAAVETPDDGSGAGVIVIEDDATGQTVGVEVNDDTQVTVDGEQAEFSELQETQQVEVTVADDGVTVETIIASTAPAEARSGPAPRQNFAVRGKVTSVAEDYWVVDGVQLPRSLGLPMPANASPDSDVQFHFRTLDDGRVILESIILAP